MLGEQRFDLAKLNTVTSDLNLAIFPSPKPDISVLSMRCQVSRLVHPRPWILGETIRNEGFGRQGRAVPVASSETRAPKTQLTDSANWRKIGEFIQDMCGSIV
jgi:hypothetical protein